MRAHTCHMAFTVSYADDGIKLPITFVRGGHFYADSNLHLTMISRWAERLWSVHITNAIHLEAESLLHRILFQIARHRDRLKQSTTQETLQEKVANEDSSDGSYHGHLSISALIYMLLCFEMFSPHIRSGVIPPMPDTFLAQQWNSRAIAYELYLDIKSEGGIAWDCLCQVFDEMDDRLSHEDDVLSPFRPLIAKAQKLPPILKGIKPNVSDGRFSGDLRRFYSKPIHDTTPTSCDGAPKRLHPWSNVAENTVKVEIDPKTNDLVVYRPNPLQVQHHEKFNITRTLAAKPPLRVPIQQSPMDEVVLWRKTVNDSVTKALDAYSKASRNWLTRPEGGARSDTTGVWMGQLVSDV